ncbi:MAG: gluconate 2-dehydrogenase subunit 3 family protein [Sphingobium sp.]|nr:gluconate 2-dehydrogenase subunit 3 family protein [Sphingobium sp.]
MSEAAPDQEGRFALDRRTVLVWAGALAAAFGTAQHFGMDLSLSSPLKADGYGRDPNMLASSVPWPRLLSAEQRQAVRLIADFILPREGEAPSAGEVGVHELVDEWVSAPYPEQQGDNALILDGLARMDIWSQRRGDAKDFASADAGVQAAVLAMVADPAGTLPTAPFWKRLRRLVIGAYYTTEAGFADIGYIGNQPLKAFPAPTPEVLAAMERAYARLGLIDRTQSAG